METFGVRYRDAIARCTAAGIVVDPVVSLTTFIHILEPHYEHWAVNKREHMRRDPNNPPTLELIINEAKDEWRRRQELASLQMNVGVSTRVSTPK